MKSRLLTLGVAVSVLAATPAASAAPPANDDFDNATIITALPFSDSVDVTEATAAADDPATVCSPDKPFFTIWYAHTPPANMRLSMGTLQSPGVSSSGVSVYTGSRGNLAEVDCTTSGGGTHGFDVTGGTTYYFMVWSFAAAVMQFDLSELLPPPSIALDINSRGTVNPKTGVATISGTLTLPLGCSTEPERRA